MRRAGAFAIAAFLVVASVARAVEAPPADSFAAGEAAFQAQDFALALEHFLAARAAGLDGPAIHYNLGVCHYKVGNWASAEEEFQLIAERFPEMRALAQYNIGLVALKEGEVERADALFRETLASTDDEGLRALASQQLQLRAPPAAEPDPEPDQEWLALIDARVGQDDNVLLLSEDFRLPDGQSLESAFTEFWALLSGPLSADGLRFDGSVYAVRYADAPIFDQSVVQIGGAYQWTFGDWRAEAGPQASYTTLDGEGFEKRLGVVLRLRRSIAQQTYLALRVMHDRIDGGAERFAAFDGDRSWVEVRVDHDVTDGRVTLGYAHEVNDRAGANVSSERDRLTARYRHYFDAGWLADVAASWRESSYAELLDPRSEKLTELSLGLTRDLAQGWQVGGEVSFGDNASNASSYVYDRSRMSVGFTKEF